MDLGKLNFSVIQRVFLYLNFFGKLKKYISFLYELYLKHL